MVLYCNHEPMVINKIFHFCLSFIFSFNSTIWSVILSEFKLAVAVGVICIGTMKLYSDWFLLIKLNFSSAELCDKLTIWASQTMDSNKDISSFFLENIQTENVDMFITVQPLMSHRAWSWWCNLLSFFNLIFISCFRMRERETRDGLVRRVAHPT